MLKVSYRSIIPFEGSGKSDRVTFVPMFGGEFRNENDLTGGGDWSFDKDDEQEVHYREKGNDFKMQERIRQVLRRTEHRQREKWEALDSEGKRHEFDSLEEFQRRQRQDGRRWKTVQKTAALNKASQEADISRSAEVVSAAMQSCAMLEASPLDGDRAELGTAFAIGNGLFVTCAHVIHRYNKMKQPREFTSDTSRLTLHQFGTSRPALLLASNLSLDLAIIRSSLNLPAMMIGSSTSKTVGTELIAIGCPKGFANNASAGILSSKDRRIFPFPGAPTYIFTDAQVLPGSSGGPLISEDDGSVIGVISMIVAPEAMYGLNAALPSEYLTDFLQEKQLR